MTNEPPPKIKRGRPASGAKTVNMAVSICPELLAQVKQAAYAKDESLSRFVCRTLEARLNP